MAVIVNKRKPQHQTTATATPAPPRQPTRSRGDLRDVTAIMVAFNRPDCVARQVESMRRFYPVLPLIIGDNGDDPARLDDQHTETRILPYNCGLADARNRLVDLVDTEFTLLLDDDYIWTADTRIDNLAAILRVDPRVDVAAGVICQDNQLWNWTGLFSRTTPGGIDTIPLSTPWKVADGVIYRQTDTVFNFFLARTATLAAFPWDSEFKIAAEHIDFFLTLAANFVGVAYTPACIIQHDQTTKNTSYQAKRRDPATIAKYRGRLCDKWRLSSIPKHRRHEEPASDLAGNLPNLVILTPGHTGSSILTWILHQLGWMAPADVDQFAEPAAIRQLNDQARQSGALDEGEAARQLAALPQPWAIKDPRFSETLDHWIGVFDMYRPALLLVGRQLDRVRESYDRRGQDPATADRRVAACDRLYQRWPWAKHRVDYETIKTALAAFEQAPRPGRDGHSFGPESN
jgi:GT2 family glycosyltransferase